MTVLWRPTLAQMEGVLQGQTTNGSTQLPISMSATGYSLMATLLTDGTAYDAGADDGATNPSAFTTLVGVYVQQASGVFLELDRLARWVFGLYSSSPGFSPSMAFDFGVITSAQLAAWNTYLSTPSGTPIPAGAQPATFSAPAPLAFDRTGGNFSTLLVRYDDAFNLGSLNLPGSQSNLQVLADVGSSWLGGVWWDNATPPVSHALTAPPVNPSAFVAAASSALTTTITTDVANCQAWLSAVAFS